jgi:hypothetical protein
MVADIAGSYRDKTERKITYPAAKAAGIVIHGGPMLVIETSCDGVISDAWAGARAGLWHPDGPDRGLVHLDLRSQRPATREPAAGRRPRPDGAPPADAPGPESPAHQAAGSATRSPVRCNSPPFTAGHLWPVMTDADRC